MIQVRLPSGKLVPVNTDDPKIAAATARAYVQRDPYEAAYVNMAKHPVLGNIYGAVESVARAVPGVSELQAALPAAVSGLTGQGFGKGWTAARAAQQAEVDNFKGQHPIASDLSTGVGMAGPVAAALATGGATAAPQIEQAAAKGVSGFLKPIATRTAKRAVTGGVAGAVYGAGQPGDLSERLGSADKGAAVGATVAAAVPPAVGAVASAAGKTGAAVGKTVARAANKATGGALIDANQVASQRLVESLKADGATPDLIKEALNGFLKNGATDPSLIDVASRLPSGGSNTLALVRAASAKGSGRGVAAKYADQTVADLQDKAIGATRKLTPGSRPASAVREEAVAARGKQADEEYGLVRDTPVDARPILPALEGDAGSTAIKGAYKAADARRLGPQMDELDKLRAAADTEVPVASVAGQQLPETPGLAEKIRSALGLGGDELPVSLGTLDRIKIALNEAGDAATRGENPSLGGGYFSRAKEIDQHLADNNPGYSLARDNFAKNSAGIDALDHGATGVTAVPEDYASNLHDFLSKGGPDAGKMAAIGYRQALTDRIGAPAEGSTGGLNKVSTSTNQGRNLAETFGAEHAEAYRAGLKDLTDQLANARSTNPNTGSPTAMRLADMGLVEPSDVLPPRIGPVHLVLGAINKIRAGATLTDAERAIIARIGTTKPDLGAIDLGDQLKLAPSAALDEARSITSGVAAGDQDQRRSANQ